MAEKRHPGITMHKLTFGSGFVGLLFTVGCSLIFVLGFPALWYFVAFSAALGLAVAIILRISTRHHSEHVKPLSIFAADATAEDAKKESQVTLRPDERRDFPPMHPRICAT
jgi:hypothetical protein